MGKMTAQDQLELQRLLEWMEANGYTDSTLAEATGDFFANVNAMTRGARRISQGFKFRFGERFGDDERNRLFRHGEPTPQK